MYLIKYSGMSLKDITFELLLNQTRRCKSWQSVQYVEKALISETM